MKWVLFFFQICFALESWALVSEYTVDTETAVRIPYAQDLSEEFLYYVFEWGDGTWAPSSLKRSGIHGFMEHRYEERGTYKGRFFAVSVSGIKSDWTAFEVKVNGPASKPREVIASCGAWISEPSSEYWDRKNVELQLDGYYALDQLIISKFGDRAFPSHFRIEYSINHGKTWHKLNTAQFFFFPDPGEQRVTVSFNGIAANAVRLLTTCSLADPEQDTRVYIGGMTLTGSKELLFDCSEQGSFIAGLNNMWYAYGSAVNEVHLDYATWGQSKRPFESGVSYMGNAEWMAWDALKMSWKPSRDLNDLRSKWLNYPLDKDGYVWACPSDPRHLSHNRHYDNNACYINGVTHYVLQTGDKEFLKHTCKTTGLTNLEKVRLAMHYQLERLGGTNGVLIIRDPEVNGTPDGKAGNYWDYFKFGYLSAYDNAEFYHSLFQMAQLERSLGEDGRASEYEVLAGEVKKKYNELFWNEETGRYIGCIDINGVRRDYGFTFVNLHALTYGLADPVRARRIMEWLDGKRIIQGEKSTGPDIYNFKIGPRANTIDMADVHPLWVETWGGELHPAQQAKYGTQIQNGGVVFYTSYYDLKSRLYYQGIDAAINRLNVIMEEFEKDELRRVDSNHVGHTQICGILLCFPESGMVPMFYIDGIMGLSPVAGGLLIAPSLPCDWKWAAVTSYWYQGKEYAIRVDRAASTPEVHFNGVRTDIIVPAADGPYRLTLDGNVSVAKERP
jgi:hypothetical protein